MVAFPLFAIVSFFDKRMITMSDTHIVRFSPSLRQSRLDKVDLLADIVATGKFDFRCERCKSSSTSTFGESHYASVVTSRRGSFDDEHDQSTTTRDSDAAKRHYAQVSFLFC